MLRELIEHLENALTEANFRRFSNAEAKRLGDRLGVDWDKVPLAEFRAGLTVELEHGNHDRQTNVTNDDLLKTGKIAWAHLKEDPKYYSRLRRAGFKDVPSVT